MFSCFSKYKYTYIDNPTLRPFKPQFDALLLTPEEVGKLYEIFRSADVDASGHITVQELFAHLATEATFFRDRVFNLFDEDGSGKIDFREFVLSLWNYCTLSKASLVIFAFDLYDADSTGQLSPKEIHNMLVDLYGKTVDTHPQAKLMNKELKAIDSVVAINVDRFRAFVTNHPALLFPAFQMQLALRQHILGVQFWNRCAEKRLMLVDGRRVALGDLSELNIHESAYLEVLDAHERAAIEEAKRRKRAEDARNSLIGWLSQKLSAKNGASVGDTAAATDEDGHPTAAPHQPLLHPRDEMAMLIIQSTGTHHYRKAVAQQRHQQVHALKTRLDSHPLATNTGNGGDSVAEDARLLATVYQQEQYESDLGQQYLMDIDRHKQHNANDLAVSNLPRTSTQLQRDHKFVGNYHASAGEKDKIAFQMKLQKMRSHIGTDGDDGGGGGEEDDHPENEEWMVKLYTTNPQAAMKIVAEKEAMKKAQRTSLGVYERTMDMVVAERANINRAKSTPAVDGDGTAPPSMAVDSHPTRVLGHLAGQSLPSHSPRPQPGSAAASHGHGHGQGHGHGHGQGHGHHRGAGDHSPAPSRPHSARSRSASPMVSPRPAHNNLTPRRR